MRLWLRVTTMYMGFMRCVGMDGRFPVSYPRHIRFGIHRIISIRWGGRMSRLNRIFSALILWDSGKFIFWGENKIVVFETSGPKGNYIVEPTVAYAKITGFTIKTKDGYTYNFGGNENLNTANDITSYNYKFGTWLNKYNGPRVRWPLVSVTSPSGRKLTFGVRQTGTNMLLLPVRPVTLSTTREMREILKRNSSGFTLHA